MEGAKKPPSAFLLFASEIRKEISKEVEWSEVSKIIAEKWRNLDNSIKDKYKTKAKEMWKTYHQNVGPVVKPKKFIKKKHEHISNSVFNLKNIDSFQQLSQLYLPKIETEKREKVQKPFALIQYAIDSAPSHKKQIKKKPKQG